MTPVSFSRKQTSNQHVKGSLEGKIFTWFKIVTYISLAPSHFIFHNAVHVLDNGDMLSPKRHVLISLQFFLK